MGVVAGLDPEGPVVFGSGWFSWMFLPAVDAAVQVDFLIESSSC